MPYCIQCGALNPDVAKFCSSCGSAMTTSRVSSSQTQSQQQGQQPERTQASVAYQQTTNQAPSTPVRTTHQPVSLVKTATHPATWGAVLILVGFFLPWSGYYDYYTSSSINGFSFAKQFMAQSTLYNNEGVRFIGVIISISLYIVLAAAAFFLLSNLIDPGISGLARLVRFLPFLVFAGIILLFIIASAATQQKLGSLSGMKIGLYMCFAGSFLMLFLRRRT